MEMKEYYLMAGQGKKATWLFLIDLDPKRGVVKGFKKGITAAAAYIKRQNGVLGDIYKLKGVRVRRVLIPVLPQVQRVEHCRHAYAKGKCPFCDGYKYDGPGAA